MSAGSTARPTVTREPLVVVLAVVALLTGGWPLASSLLPDTEPVPAGSLLEVGPDRQAAVTVTDGGWRVRRASSNPDQSYSLTRGGVDLTVSFAALASEPTPDQLWSGFQQVVRTNGGRLGEPSAVTTRAGQSGRSGPLHQGEQAGTGYAIPAPDDSFAVEFTVLSTPDAAAADVAAAEQVVLSLTLQAGGA